MTNSPQILNAGRIQTKIYIGNLPINIDEQQLRMVFQEHCEVVNIILKKANAQGNFDKFCYGFITLGCDEPKTLDVINRIEKSNPNWKLKIKDENHDNRDRGMRPPQNNQYQAPYQSNMNHQNMGHQSMGQHQPMGHQSMSHQNINSQSMGHQGMGYQPMNHPMTPPMMHMGPPQRQNFYPSNQAQNDKGEVQGEKQNKIIVRQLWLGGIPEMTDKQYMTNVMSQFGDVQSTEIFPKFAFVKFKRAIDATNAYERASKIYQTFGQNSGFRIAFSEPSKRKDVVGNSFEHERNAIVLPVLFLGFPPITSAKIDLGYMIQICQKFGPITNYFMKKSTNSQMRSYFLFTYDSVKTAMRARMELGRRKDMLGQKRVQITLLLDDNVILQGRDFSYTEKHFLNDQVDKSKKAFRPPQNNYQQQQQQTQNHYQHNIPNYSQGVMPQHMGMSGGYNPPMDQYYSPQNNYNPMNYYYPSPTPPNAKENVLPQTKTSQTHGEAQDVINLINGVFDSEQKQKIPQKSSQTENQNAKSIISKVLRGDSDEKKEEEGELNNSNDINKDRQPDWSGFLTWKGARRAGVDGFAVNNKQCDLTEYNINVGSVMELDEVHIKDKSNLIILEPTNSISQPVFNDYLKAFTKKAGISLTKNWLIYIIGKSQLSDSIQKIANNQLLMVMDKSSQIPLIKDKVKPCDDIYFE